MGASSASAASAVYTQPCPLYGQNFPAPTGLSTNNAFQVAASSLKSQLAGTVNGTTNATSLFGTLDTQATAFSVEFFSLNEDDPLFTYHYTPSLFSQNNTGTTSVNSDSVYRIGSVSKLWTVYLYLITAGDGSWNDPITKYVPELEEISQAQKSSDAVNNVNWESITIGALASQLAGIGRDAVYSPQLASMLEQLGVPNQGGNDHSTCGSLSLDIMTPCNRSQFFTDYPTQHPVVSAFQTPIYSNAAFQILSYALENITGQTTEALFDKYLVSDLNLTSTSYAAPNTTTNAVIPPFDTTTSWFSADLHDEIPAGGYYSSINDMRAIGKAMLSSAQLDPAVTRRWMKPHSLISNPDAMVGAPWELQRAPGSPYLMMMTKSGDVGVYASYIVLVPELEVGFSVLTAGAGFEENVEVLADVLAATLVPAARGAAAEEAKAKYEGVYADAATASNITLEVVGDEPGLAVTGFTFGGEDVFATLLDGVFGANTTARLYPTGLSTTTSNGTTTSAWRAVYQVVPEAADPGAFSSNCVSWAKADSVIYGGVGLDEYLITTASAEVVSVTPRVLGVAMTPSA